MAELNGVIGLVGLSYCFTDLKSYLYKILHIFAQNCPTSETESIYIVFVSIIKYENNKQNLNLF